MSAIQSSSIYLRKKPSSIQIEERSNPIPAIPISAIQSSDTQLKSILKLSGSKKKSASSVRFQGPCEEPKPRPAERYILLPERTALENKIVDYCTRIYDFINQMRKGIGVSREQIKREYQFTMEDEIFLSQMPSWEDDKAEIEEGRQAALQWCKMSFRDRMALREKKLKELDEAIEENGCPVSEKQISELEHMSQKDWADLRADPKNGQAYAVFLREQRRVLTKNADSASRWNGAEELDAIEELQVVDKYGCFKKMILTAALSVAVSAVYLWYCDPFSISRAR